jgi:putative ABC transport system ATP-binding protein
MIRCQQLGLVYPDGTKVKTILQDINLKIEQGENVVLLGPSGSGKSSLIYLLSSLRQPTNGEIYWNDELLSVKNSSSLRKEHFGFIFQMHFLLPYLTALENVLVAKNEYTLAAKTKATEILEQLGLAGHENKKIHQLSGGQRQRVAIARALMNEPDVIFADEPTASLDHSTALEVMEILKNHKKNSILIMATHDTSILSGDERIIQIANGRVFENAK